MKKLIIGTTIVLGAVGATALIPNKETTPLTIEEKVEKDKGQDGSYQQKKKGELNPNVEVNVFDGPEGKGYQIVTEYPDRIEYVGKGAYAKDNTYTVFKPDKTATST